MKKMAVVRRNVRNPLFVIWRAALAVLTVTMVCSVCQVDAAWIPAPSRSGERVQSQPQKPTKGEVKLPVGTPIPTVSEGDTAGVIRGRPAPAPARPLHVAYRAALSQPAVRSASETELRAQLRSTPPIAFVNGYWLIPVDLGRIYNQPSVRAALLPSIRGAIAGQHVGFVFIANEFADSFQIPRADLLQMMGADALRIKATGSWLHPSGGGVNIMTAIDWIQGAFNWFKAWQQNRQAEKQNKDCKDKGPTGDCDGDGTANADDTCPFDPTCGEEKRGFVGCVVITCRMFTTRIGGQTDTLIDQVAQAIRHSSQSGSVVALGQVATGPGSINIAFPTGQ